MIFRLGLRTDTPQSAVVIEVKAIMLFFFHLLSNWQDKTHYFSIPNLNRQKWGRKYKGQNRLFLSTFSIHYVFWRKMNTVWQIIVLNTQYVWEWPWTHAGVGSEVEDKRLLIIYKWESLGISSCSGAQWLLSIEQR